MRERQRGVREALRMQHRSRIWPREKIRGILFLLPSEATLPEWRLRADACLSLWPDVKIRVNKGPFEGQREFLLFQKN